MFARCLLDRVNGVLGLPMVQGNIPYCVQKKTLTDVFLYLCGKCLDLYNILGKYLGFPPT